MTFKIFVVCFVFVFVIEDTSSVFPCVDGVIACFFIEHIDECVVRVFRVTCKTEDDMVAFVFSYSAVSVLQWPCIPYVHFNFIAVLIGFCCGFYVFDCGSIKGWDSELVITVLVDHILHVLTCDL